MTYPTVVTCKRINTYGIDCHLLRHAESLVNVYKIFNTISTHGYHLTDEGNKQVQNVELKLTDKVLIISSTFDRCKETSELLKLKYHQIIDIIYDNALNEQMFYDVEYHKFDVNYVFEYEKLCVENPLCTKTSFGNVESGINLLSRCTNGLQNGFDYAHMNGYTSVIFVGHRLTIQIMINLLEGTLPFKLRYIGFCSPIHINYVERPTFEYYVETKPLCFRIPLDNVFSLNDAQTCAENMIQTIIKNTQTKTRIIHFQVIENEFENYELFAILTEHFKFQQIDYESFIIFTNKAKELFPNVTTTIPKCGSCYYVILETNNSSKKYQQIQSQITCSEPQKNDLLKSIVLNSKSRIIWENEDETFGFYPETTAEPTYTGFIESKDFGALISIANENKQTGFTIIDCKGNAFTICL